MRIVALVTGIFLGAIGAPGMAATPKRTAALDAMMARVHCGFGDEGVQNCDDSAPNAGGDRRR